MRRPKISLIAAIHNRSRAIAVDGKIPWSRPEDLARFQRLTTGDAVLMGRKTYQSLPDHATPLPDRYNVVLTADDAFAKQIRSEKVVAVESRRAALQATEIRNQLWIAGGASVYEQFAGFADEMHLTWVWEKEDENFGIKGANNILKFPEHPQQLKNFVFERESYEERDGYAFEHLVR